MGARKPPPTAALVYPPPPQPVVYAVPAPVVVVGSRKDPATAAILAFLFGPLGLLYSTVAGATVMFVISLVVAFLTLGFGLILLWPVYAIVGWQAAKNTNARVSAAAGYAYAGVPVGGGAAAGWYPDPHQQAASRYWDGVRWTEHTH